MTTKIEMTKQEALDFSFALDEAQKACVNALNAIDRKRSWRDSEKAMAKVPYARRLEQLTKLNERIQQAAQIRGW